MFLTFTIFFQTITCTFPPNLGGGVSFSPNVTYLARLVGGDIMLFMLFNILPHFFSPIFLLSNLGASYGLKKYSICSQLRLIL